MDLLEHLLTSLACVFGYEIKYLREMGKTFSPDTNVLMLGTGSGQMALLMHLGARENFSEPYPAKMFNFYTVDWGDTRTYEAHMGWYGFDPGEVIEGKTWEVADRFKDESIDFLIVDACHWRDCVERDIDAYWSKVKVGGLVFFHDYIKKETDNGVKEAIDSRKDETWEEICYPGISAVYRRLA